MSTSAKTQQLQIRVSPEEKEALRMLAERAGTDVSTFVLARALPRLELEFNRLLQQVREPGLRGYALSAINDMLTDVSATDYPVVCGEPWGLLGLDARMQNYIAAMVEEAAGHLGLAPPEWTGDVAPLEEPWFNSEFVSLRPWLLMASPVPFRRRNIFVESVLGTRAATGSRARARVPGFRGGEGTVRYASRGVTRRRVTRVAESGPPWGDGGLISREEILRMLHLLDSELGERGASGELFLVGGAVMCLAFGAREATRDVDAAMRPADVIKSASAAVARREGLPEGWLNDAVKGFLSERGGFDPWLDLPRLRIYVAQPEYLLAMKCIAMRAQAESRDRADVRFLLRYLDIRTAEGALEVVSRYYDEPMVTLRTRLALEEMIGETGL